MPNPAPHHPPLVAVSAASEDVDGRARVRLNRVYTDALLRAGFLPVAAPPMDPAYAATFLSRIDGLVLSGGDDVEPRLYGQPPHPTADRPDPERDAWEIALVHAAHQRALPTLAICRGAQLANVALGGTLVQDIPSERPDTLAHSRAQERGRRVHRAVVDAPSRLAAALGAAELSVNSLHHQAVDRPGEGLRVVARADDGIVEALEWTGDDWWMVGVQWHPEELDTTAEPWDRALLAAFRNAVSASTANASRRAPGA
ncbi:MAG TPA: gamma-glutamyl-gamma-aminobutyrate hydrolase family protein [Gemmatimonadaceae bacterium]|nr:gamma-glutamyl-gamma-aminobutyrate hydrolase family protein [Gemmatimonadaceae bacterium]